jgi:hypothetical protein
MRRARASSREATELTGSGARRLEARAGAELRAHEPFSTIAVRAARQRSRREANRIVTHQALVAVLIGNAGNRLAFVDGDRDSRDALENLRVSLASVTLRTLRSAGGTLRRSGSRQHEQK